MLFGVHCAALTRLLRVLQSQHVFERRTSFCLMNHSTSAGSATLHVGGRGVDDGTFTFLEPDPGELERVVEGKEVVERPVWELVRVLRREADALGERRLVLQGDGAGVDIVYDDAAVGDFDNV